MFSELEVNGPGRHPLYARLAAPELAAAIEKALG